MIKSVISFAFLLCVITPLQAQQVTVRGTASVTYKDSLTPEVRNHAFEKARLNAVESFFAQGGEAETENFDKNITAITENIEKFAADATKINENDDPDSKRYSVVVRVRLNVARLRITIKRSSAVASSTSGEKSKIIFVFVGREADSVKMFDDRVVKQSRASSSDDTRSSSSKKGNESENITSNSVSTSDSVSTRNQTRSEVNARTETGGSTTRRKDQVTRVVFETNDLNASVKGAFSAAGFDVSDADFVLSNQLLSTINKEFTTANRLAPASLRAVAASLQQNSIPYFVLATLDVGRQDTDPATGAPRVSVSITGEIYDLTDWPPTTAAAVPPFQIVGIGPDPEAARRQALRKASLDASRELISRMNVGGIR